MTSVPSPLARFEAYAQGEAKYSPGSPGAAAWFELCRLRERVVELERELSMEQNQYDELLAECGGVSSPPWIEAAPKGQEKRAG